MYLFTPQYRIERVLSRDELCGKVAGDERYHEKYEELIEGAQGVGDKDAIREGELYRILLEVGDEYAKGEERADERADERVERRLEHIRYFDGIRFDADTLEDTDVASPRERINEDDDENGNGGDDDADGTDERAEEVEGILDVGEELRRSFLKGLYLCEFAHTTRDECLFYLLVLARRLDAHCYLVRILVIAPKEPSELTLGNEGVEVHLVDFRLNDAFYDELF